MGSPSVLLPAFQTSGVLLFAKKDKWLWRECTFVRIFIILLCVFREAAGKVEEFMELCFKSIYAKWWHHIHPLCLEERGGGSRLGPLSHPFYRSHLRSQWV